MSNWTHTGKFYGLPVYISFNAEDDVEMVMRYTCWSWPVEFLAVMHQLMNSLHGTDFQFRISDVRPIE